MIRTLWAGPDKPDINAALGDWCAAQIGLPRGFRDHSSMGVFDDADLIGALVFHDWQPERGLIEISGAATTPRWLTRPVLKAMFEYPFVQLGVQMVVMRVSERNAMWNGRGLPRLLKAYGFNAYPIPRLRGRDEGEIIYTLTDDDWAGNGFHKDAR
jgi:hypothetical protein